MVSQQQELIRGIFASKFPTSLITSGQAAKFEMVSLIVSSSYIWYRPFHLATCFDFRNFILDTFTVSICMSWIQNSTANQIQGNRSHDQARGPGTLD